jgi:hypothetical protein
MEILDQNVKIEDQPSAATVDPAPSPTPEPDAEPKPARKPGRPPKDKAPDPRDSEPKPAPKPRKEPEEHRDARGALLRDVESLNVHFRAYQAEHPESDMAWAWRKLRETLPEETGRIGAPIEESAFTPPIAGAVRGVEMLADLPAEDRATRDEINDVAQSWARASTHLGLSERMAAVGSAVSKSVGLVGRQISRVVVHVLATPPANPDPPMDKPAPPAEGSGDA